MFHLELNRMPPKENEPKRIGVNYAFTPVQGDWEGKHATTRHPLGIVYVDGVFVPFSEKTELRPEFMKQICNIAENFNLFYNNIK